MCEQLFPGLIDVHAVAGAAIQLHHESLQQCHRLICEHESRTECYAGAVSSGKTFHLFSLPQYADTVSTSCDSMED